MALIVLNPSGNLISPCLLFRMEQKWPGDTGPAFDIYECLLRGTGEKFSSYRETTMPIFILYPFSSIILLAIYKMTSTRTRTKPNTLKVAKYRVRRVLSLSLFVETS